MSFHQCNAEAVKDILVAAIAAKSLPLEGSVEERVTQLAEAFKTLYQAVAEAGSA